MNKTKLRPATFAILFVASVINAVGVALILAPVKLFDSGISGTAFLLDMITPPCLVMSFFLIVCNFPFYIIGYKKLGKEFVIYSLFAITIYSLAAFIFRNVLPLDFSDGSPITHGDMLLSALFGGLLSGVGSGLVIRCGGAIDGVEVMAVLFAKKLGITVGTFVMGYNILLYSVSALIFKSWVIPLYSIITYTVGIKTIDFIVEGLDKAKAVFIISDKSEQLQKLLSETLGRGVTAIDAQGYYSGEKKVLIYCVVNRFEIRTVKSIVNSVDNSAFVTINDVSETIGGEKMLGFSKI
ncbi:MAG: YitT family protein [Clostridia bacterium]